MLNGCYSNLIKLNTIIDYIFKYNRYRWLFNGKLRLWSAKPTVVAEFIQQGRVR